MNVYDFRSGRSIKGVSPQRLGEALEDLRKQKGKLVAEDVLDMARDPQSEFHSAFTWDDGEAAEKYRLQEARRLIVSIRVLNGPAAKPTVAFVSVREPEVGRNYVATAEALSSEELRVRLLNEARQAVESLERRYASFAEVADVLDKLKRAVA